MTPPRTLGWPRERWNPGSLDPLAKRPIQISARRQRVIRCDCTLEIVGFHAGDQANLFQRRRLLLGFGGIPEHQIEFTEVPVRALRWRRLSTSACW